MWEKISKEVLNKAQYIVPLKKGELQLEYAKALVKIDKIKSAIKGDIDGFATINAHGESQEILDLLEIYLEILEDKGLIEYDTCYNAKIYNSKKNILDRLQQENQQLKIQISAREEEYRKLEDKLVEIENWLRPAILQLMKITKQDYYWITNQQIDNSKFVPLNFTVTGDRSVKFEKLERGVSDGQ